VLKQHIEDKEENTENNSISEFNMESLLDFNPLRTKHTCAIKGFSAYRTVNTFQFGYQNQSLNDI
jgi:hypothetical protein